MKKIWVIIAVLYTLALLGCVAPANDSMLLPTPKVATKQFSKILGSSEATDLSDLQNQLAVSDTPLTLERAIRAALLFNPNIRAAYLGVKESASHIVQEGLLPNPELELEGEELWPSGDEGPTGSAGFSLAITQPIELGGKRGKRVAVARFRGVLTGWDFEKARLDLIQQTTDAFNDLLVAQKKVALRTELLSFGQSALAAVRLQVQNGKALPLNAEKSFVEVQSNQLALSRADDEVRIAKEHLGALLGVSGEKIGDIEGDLEKDIIGAPSRVNLERLMMQDPALARWRDELALKNAEIRLEKAEGVPDLELTVSRQKSNATDEYSWGLGLSLPLPLFNRNQGAVTRERYALSRLHFEQKASLLEARAEISEVHKVLVQAFSEITNMKDSVVPTARKVYSMALSAYKLRKIPYIEMLDAKKTLVETQEQYIDLLYTYHKAKTAVERRIGQELETLIQENENETE